MAAAAHSSLCSERSEHSLLPQWKWFFVEVGDRPIIDHLTGVAKHQKQAELMVIAIYIRKKSSRGNVSPARAQSNLAGWCVRAGWFTQSLYYSQFLTQSFWRLLQCSVVSKYLGGFFGTHRWELLLASPWLTISHITTWQVVRGSGCFDLLCIELIVYVVYFGPMICLCAIRHINWLECSYFSNYTKIANNFEPNIFRQ